MAKLYVSEYATISNMPTVVGQVPLEPPLTEYVLDYTAGMVTSPPFQQGTRMVRMNTDAVCSLVIGSNPAATTQNGRWAKDQTECRGVPEGQGFKVSVISNV